jgi:hypothetical protein
MSFAELATFVRDKMSRSHVYQPLVVLSGTAPATVAFRVSRIAQVSRDAGERSASDLLDSLVAAFGR